MRPSTPSIALLALVPVVLAQGNMQINTLSGVTECVPSDFTWSGGVPPYYLSLVPAGQPSAQAIMQFPPQNGDSMTWLVSLPPGTSFTSALRDSTGAQAFSDAQTVQPGTENSCSQSSTTVVMTATSMTGQNSSAASTGSATTASTAEGTRGTTSAATKSSTTASTTVSVQAAHDVTSAATAGTAPSASSTSSNAASLHTSAGAIGIAGLLGLVGAALLG
ncbi:hypothetical protein C8Q79DRAFT_501300 [Trametes meyenii]|nr:hypothetical protein C8Q79DRAFT_501300 [Trametes meyenii]